MAVSAEGGVAAGDGEAVDAETAADTAADWAKLNCANSSRQAPVKAIFMTLFCR